jgi:hypothetical protein
MQHYLINTRLNLLFEFNLMGLKLGSCHQDVPFDQLRHSIQPIKNIYLTVSVTTIGHQQPNPARPLKLNQPPKLNSTYPS